MVDNLSKKDRSKCMSRIRSRDTLPEGMLRDTLWRKGYRYRKNHKLLGKPDIVFVRKKVAIFVDGCFWHKCPKCYVEPKSNKEYWLPKIQRNIERDKKNTKELKAEGWKVVRIWEHDIKKNLDKTLEKLDFILSG